MASSTTSDTTGVLNTTDYVLNALVIVTSDGSYQDVRQLMVELNLYEDIFSPTMSGMMIMGDALDMIASNKMHGNEYLLVSVDKPSLNMPIVKTFRIYKIGERSLGSNGLQNYKVYFCSEEFFLSSQTLVSKSYKGLTIDKMVQDLLVRKLKVASSKIAAIETTGGNFDFIIPRMSPLQAISWLCPRAYNSNRNLYFFFENRDGFNFISYETLLGLPAYATYSYGIKLDQDPVKNSNMFNVLNILEDFDGLKALRSGAYSSTLATYDVISRQYKAKNFNVTQLANNAVLNSDLPANDFNNRLGANFYNTTDNMLKYVVMNDADPTRNPQRYDKWLAQTASRLGLLNSFKMAGVLPGDVMIKAGMTINVNILKQEVQDSTTTLNKMRSGRYLISTVKHKFIQSIMSTTVELLSDSTSAPMNAPLATSPVIAQVITQ
jgi:hypothetical protein